MAAWELVPTSMGGTNRPLRTTLTNADATSDAVPGGGAENDKTVSVGGTFGGATVTIQGTLDPGVSPTWFTAHDPEGNPLAFAAADMQAIRENVVSLRAVLTGGAGSTLVVHLLHYGR